MVLFANGLSALRAFNICFHRSVADSCHGSRTATCWCGWPGLHTERAFNQTFARYYMGAVCLIADRALERNAVYSFEFAADASGGDLRWRLLLFTNMEYYELRKQQYLGKQLVLNSADFGKAAVQDSNPSPKKSDRQFISAAVRPWRFGHPRILARAQWRSAL